jgi:hypothetical protein
MSLVDRKAFAVVSTQTASTMENRQPAVGIVMHFHRRFDEVRTQRALRDL